MEHTTQCQHRLAWTPTLPFSTSQRESCHPPVTRAPGQHTQHFCLWRGFDPYSAVHHPKALATRIPRIDSPDRKPPRAWRWLSSGKQQRLWCAGSSHCSKHRKLNCRHCRRGGSVPVLPVKKKSRTSTCVNSWQCPEPAWTGLRVPRAGGRGPSPRQGGWNEMVCKVPPNPHRPVTLWVAQLKDLEDGLAEELVLPAFDLPPLPVQLWEWLAVSQVLLSQVWRELRE